MAPLIAIGFGIVTAGGRDKDPTMALIIGGANLLIIVLGFAFAIVALVGIRRHGREGIVAPALIGLVLNGLLIASFFATMSAANRLAAARAARQGGGGGGATPGQVLTPAAQQEQRRLEQRGADMIRDHPGWLGLAEHRGAAFAVTQWPSGSEFVDELKRNTFAADCTVVSIGVDNARAGAAATPVVFDPPSAQLHFADGRVVKALDPKRLLKLDAEDRNTYLRNWAQPRRVEAGAKQSNTIVLFPPDADLTNVTGVSFTVDGERVTIPGRHYTVAEKAEVFRASTAPQQQQQQQQHGP